MCSAFSKQSHISIDLSRSVRSRLLNELLSLTAEERGRIWHTNSSTRTSHYLAKMLPALAEACDASWTQRELHRFDATFGTEFVDPLTSAKLRIPKLILESENVVDSAHHELERLCWTFAPLRILVTVAEWSPAQFPHTASRTRLRERWDSYIRGFDNSLRLWNHHRNGVLAILVGECGADEILRFYSYEFREFSATFFPGPDHEEVFEVGPTPKPRDG